MSSPDTERNIREWTRMNVEYTDPAAERAWAREEYTWGLWAVPDSELGVLGDVLGLDVVELGCGTAYCSARLARAGAQVPATEHLLRPQFRSFRYEWPGRLIEVQAPESAVSHGYYDTVTAEWARQWPSEDIWVARKRA